MDDNTRYYWRVKTIDANGTQSKFSPYSRFYLNTSSDKKFMDMSRVDVKNIKVSSGFNKKNICDLDDPGQASFWQSTPPGFFPQWVEFDLGDFKDISRIWMLSNPNSCDGWLKSFVWQYSNDRRSWSNIEKTKITLNDTYRNILNFPAVNARYFRLGTDNRPPR